MNRYTGTTRPKYFWPLIAGVVGLLVGWLVIGWGVWPVKWKNTLPQDLRPDYRNHYLTMVAESYAGSGDLELARARLDGWPRDSLEKALTDLHDSAVQVGRGAADIQDLGAALGLSGAVPVPPEEEEVPVEPGRPGSWLTVLLWLAIIAVALGLFVYLFRRWRAAHGRDQEPVIGDARRPSAGARSAASVGRAAEEIAERAKEQWPVLPEEESPRAGPAPEGQPWTAGGRGEDILARPAELEEPRRSASRPAAPREQVGAGRAGRPESRDSAITSPPASGRAVPVGGTGAKLGDYVAIYQMGEPDYDEAFDINDPVDGYLGQCGLQLNEPVGRNRDQAVALQVWLWDGSDPDTRLKVLMSEGAYRDTDLRSQQGGEHEVIAVREGSTFRLESHDLVLNGTVEKVEYADQEPYRGVFAELQVRLQVYRRS